MASKSGQEPSATSEDIEELLEAVDKTLDRLKTLYEQYFLGIQKQAPAYIHSDVERKLRDLTQLQIRNTGLRYRLNSIQAKFAAYNSYWRRTLRQIENGTYARNLSKIGRAAARSGADIPEEILAAMPKRMREQVLKDREVALAAARRHNQVDEETLSLEGEEPAFIKEGTELRRQVRGAHVVKEDADFDLDAFFKEVESGDAADKTPEDQPPVAPPERAPVRAATMPPPQRQSSPVLRTPTGPVPNPNASGGIRATGPVPAVQPGAPNPNAAGGIPPQRATGPVPAMQPGTPAQPGQRATGPLPAVPSPGQRATGPVPVVPAIPRPGAAPSQASRPNPIAPGSAAAHGDASVESMAGPFPRQQTAAGAAGPVRPPTGPVPNPNATGPVRTPTGPVPNPNATGPVRTPTGPVPNPNATGPVRTPTGPVPNPNATGPVRTPTGPVPNPNATGPVRTPTGPVPNPNATGTVPRSPTGPVPTTGPTRAPGVPRAAPPVSAQSQPTRPTPMPRPDTAGGKPPPGMSDADVNALYAKYVKAKESVGEKVGPGGYGKLLNTINQQAPKIMEQYKAKGVDFSVVVKDNQVIIRAKPKS